MDGETSIFQVHGKKDIFGFQHCFVFGSGGLPGQEKISCILTVTW